MAKEKNQSSIVSGNKLSISRVFDAPRELVYEVWTKPEHIVNWWGPDGFTCTISEMEVKEGGVWRFMMHGPDGRDYPNKIIFTKIIPPELICYKHTGEDETENIRFSVIVELKEIGKTTMLTMTSVFETSEELERVSREYGAVEGLEQTVGRLGRYLESINEQSKQNVSITLNLILNSNL